MNPLSEIRSIQRLTPEVIQELRTTLERNYIELNPRVSQTEFYDLLGSEYYPVEHRGGENQIVVLLPGNLIHESLESVMTT